MVCVIQFNMDNAAFGETAEEKAAEMNRILNKLAGKFESVDLKKGEHFNIMDFNGNSVGSMSIVPE